MVENLIVFMKWKHICLVALITYIAIFFSMAVLLRESSDKCSIRLDLFKEILEPGPEVYKDLILNIIGFIPIGALTGFLIERYRLARVLLVGLLVSLTIEFSQLICTGECLMLMTCSIILLVQ